MTKMKISLLNISNNKYSRTEVERGFVGTFNPESLTNIPQHEIELETNFS